MLILGRCRVVAPAARSIATLADVQLGYDRVARRAHGRDQGRLTGGRHDSGKGHLVMNYRVTIRDEHDRPKCYRVQTRLGAYKAVAIGSLAHASRYPGWPLYRIEVEELGDELADRAEAEEPGLFDDRMEW